MTVSSHFEEKQGERSHRCLSFWFCTQFEVSFRLQPVQSQEWKTGGVRKRPEPGFRTLATRLAPPCDLVPLGPYLVVRFQWLLAQQRALCRHLGESETVLWGLRAVVVL